MIIDYHNKFFVFDIQKDEPNDIFYEMSSLSVLIYNFALEPYKAQNELAWAASFILVMLILIINILTRIFGRITTNS